MPRRVRTILVEDSTFMRKVISDIIGQDDSIELVGTATNGQAGSDLAIRLKPDVVITDMVMPDFDGMFLVKSLMEKNPLPIILLSSLEKTDARIFDALQRGAFEFIDKPANLDKETFSDYPLINLIKEASRTDISLLKAKQLASKNAHVHTFSSTLQYDILVIGASTGGPGAVEFVINNLPRNLSIPVVVAQHMPERFLESFALRLNESCALPVKLAHSGEPLKGGVVYIAPGHANTRIDVNILSGLPCIAFTSKKFLEFNYPSVDCLFESVAQTYGKKSIGLILTGMGKDGAKGINTISNKGGYTIAQDEESSVVYGMPRAAYDTGNVKQVLNLKEIPGFIISCL
jgi:two-component system, chemotaxis family, protein-glutamate methylesterase/glutaminase